MNKWISKNFGLRLYISMAASLILFFTVYAYRHNVMDFLHAKGYLDFSIDEKSRTRIEDEFKDIEIINGNMNNIHNILKKSLPGYGFSLYGDFKAYGDIHFMNSRGIAPYRQSSKYSSTFKIKLNHQMDKINITVYPNFKTYYYWYTCVSAILAILFGAFIFMYWTIVQKKSKRHKRLKKIWNTSALQAFHKLSIELLFVNIAAAFLSFGSFSFMYINRYSFIEFIRDHVSYDHAMDVYAASMQEKLQSFHLTNINKKEINSILKQDIAKNAEAYIYLENGKYYQGGNLQDTEDIRMYSDFGVSALMIPYLYYFPLKTVDETAILLIYYYPLTDFINWYRAIIIIFSLSVYILLLMKFIRTKVSFIQVLQKDVAALALGDWNHEITKMQDDEIGQLGEELRSMQTSFFENMKNEKAAKKANQELVTSLSHDLRTPLTSLLGYLELIRYRDGTNEEKKRYLDHSLQKVEQIRSLSDKLFEYFLVYERAESLELHEESLETWLSYVEETADFMKRDGLDIQLHLEKSIELNAAFNLEMLQRATDNLFSNIHKYANRKYPVIIKGCVLDHVYKVHMANTIREDTEKIESNQIGLKSAEEIMRLHHGTLHICEKGESFSIEMTLPIIERE